MKTTNYICDLCKTSKSEEDLCQMSVETKGLKINKGTHYNLYKVDICRECLEKKGFIINPIPEQTEEETKKEE